MQCFGVSYPKELDPDQAFPTEDSSDIFQLQNPAKSLILKSGFYINTSVYIKYKNYFLREKNILTKNDIFPKANTSRNI